MTAKRVLIASLAMITIIVVGCTPRVISNDAGVYLNATLYASSSQNVAAVYAAALTAMDRLKLQVTDKGKDAFGAVVTAKTTDGKTITVAIEPMSNMRTKYTIHVGLFGDEERSQRIFDEMVHALDATKGS